MTPTTSAACPKCRQPIASGAKFCANCGNDISGVWNQSDPGPLGGTIAVEMDPHADTLGQLLSEATLGEYDVYGELGRGGMAAVYLGLDLALNRKVAIKTMLPELVSREGMVARFKREAQTAAALNHPHIIQIYTVKETKTLVYFVMKFIEGRSLESVINDKGHVPLPMTQTILGQVGSALDYAHRKHVIHRDIKPANIMIDEDGWAIVTDFGIAKVQEAQNLTATGTAIGTPHYMSPEQFHNKAVTGLSDQYSLGVVAYEMLAGKKPFDGGTYAEIITQHLFEQVPDLRKVNPEVPEHVVEVVRKMMAKDPAERFPDLDSAIHALGAPPSKKEGDVVRTQMIDLAKSGPQKKVRMSVPMSPIPVQKKRPSPAATIAEQPAVKPMRKRPTAPEPAKSGAGKWMAAAAVVVLAGGGYFGMQYVNAQKRAAATVVTQQAASAAPATDSGRPSVAESAAARAQADSIAQADSVRKALEKHIADSIGAVAAATAKKREKHIADSIRLAEQKAAKSAPAKKETAAVQSAVQAAAPAPVVQAPAEPQTATIRIGSPTPGAGLYVDDHMDALISAVRVVTVPAGKPVKLEIRADGCQAWDTTVTLAPGSTNTIGRRFAKCP
ncbi:MAG TPA: serine/threonine-protein kinase [Gemmatimonadaceae bacterium]|nr:serine/threonine-protein kinase [Gemmatimonadaceae bacterium]